MTPSCAQAAALPPLATAAGGRLLYSLCSVDFSSSAFGSDIGFGSVLCSTSLANMPGSPVASGDAVLIGLALRKALRLRALLRAYRAARRVARAESAAGCGPGGCALRTLPELGRR